MLRRHCCRCYDRAAAAATAYTCTVTVPCADARRCVALCHFLLPRCAGNAGHAESRRGRFHGPVGAVDTGRHHRAQRAASASGWCVVTACAACEACVCGCGVSRGLWFVRWGAVGGAVAAHGRSRTSHPAFSLAVSPLPWRAAASSLRYLPALPGCVAYTENIRDRTVLSGRSSKGTASLQERAVNRWVVELLLGVRMPWLFSPHSCSVPRLAVRSPTVHHDAVCFQHHKSCGGVEGGARERVAGSWQCDSCCFSRRGGRQKMCRSQACRRSACCSVPVGAVTRRVAAV